MKLKCSKCGQELPKRYSPPRFCDWCPTCKTHTVMYATPEDPKNKVYAVDIYETVSRCMMFEASSQEEAEKKAAAFMDERLLGCTREEALNELRDLGFEDGEDFEYKVSGECNSDGDIEYY